MSNNRGENSVDQRCGEETQQRGVPPSLTSDVVGGSFHNSFNFHFPHTTYQTNEKVEDVFGMAILGKGKKNPDYYKFYFIPCLGLRYFQLKSD
jgi:hypothetical protein